MDHSDFRILGLAASGEPPSPWHREGGARGGSGWMSCEGFDLARIPYFNQDIEDQGHPEPVQSLGRRFGTYDGTHSNTGVRLRYPRRLDRRSGLVPALASQPHALPSQAGRDRRASPGGSGTARGQMVLRQILLHPPAYVMPEPQILILLAPEVRSGDGRPLDKETRERLRRFLAALAEWAQRFEEPRKAHQRQTPERRV